MLKQEQPKNKDREVTLYLNYPPGRGFQHAGRDCMECDVVKVPWRVAQRVVNRGFGSFQPIDKKQVRAEKPAAKKKSSDKEPSGVPA